MSTMPHKISLRVPEGFHRKAKMAAVRDGVPLGAFLEKLVDQHERKFEAARRRQPSPLHRVDVRDDDE